MAINGTTCCHAQQYGYAVVVHKFVGSAVKQDCNENGAFSQEGVGLALDKTVPHACQHTDSPLAVLCSLALQAC